MRLCTLTLLLSPALINACLHTYGTFSTNGEVFVVTTVDNGAVTCDSFNQGWRIDQDGHYSAGCLPGYVYAMTTDGSTAWYGNPVSAFQFSQSPTYAGSSGVYHLDDSRFGCQCEP